MWKESQQLTGKITGCLDEILTQQVGADAVLRYNYIFDKNKYILQKLF
jgi:hypothetical protein